MSSTQLNSIVLILLLLGAWKSSAHAIPLAVVNHSFEDITGENQSNEFTFGPLTGWDLYDPGIITDGGDGPTYYIGTLTPFEPDPIGNPGVFANFPDGALDGQRVAIAFNFAPSGGGGEYGLVQTTTHPLQANTTYTVRVGIGNIASATSMNGTPFELSGFPGYRVDVLANGALLDQDNNYLAGSIPDGEFATSVISFTTGANPPQENEDIVIRLVNLNEVDPSFPSSDIEVDFDDVRLDASIAGDFDLDDDVDGSDFFTWQRGHLMTYDGADLLVWQDNFGNSVVAAAAQLVPEPGPLTLVWLLAFCRQRSHKYHALPRH